MTTQRNSRIIGMQFSILSPEEIRKMSACEITNRDTYIGNKPALGGLFDPRMGVLEPGIICPTDGLDYIKTPGYFGHIELAKPVFYIQYLNTVIKILRCVCIKCNRLKINKEKYAYLLDKSADYRWNQVFSIASKVKRCGEDCPGCGCKQPSKIKKEGLATIFAEWDNIDGVEEQSKLSMKLTPEIILKNLKRISDEDINFMGFSPTWSRPEWMICQVLAVPPPAVRPSIKHDSQQRSEDDITHILVNIIKANNSLQEKIQSNAPANIIEDWVTVLQYYIATQVDNNIPGVASVAQRSGRPLKTIKERMNGKAGRVRGNLMGKRVDFSARSVIGPDPCLSIRELGVPLKIAKNITKPEIVNDKNKNYLLKLVQNGPDVHPGAKILEKKTGEQISLRYVDRKSIRLETGDIVHRHMMDGDAVLFNRQPTLHRMSMMCHIAKVMKKGDTFRMNVAATKPYNADFDGDEMNLHMPQDAESEMELKQLAAIPYQIISPSNNKSIIGIFQDSLLGCYRFTRENINFTHRDAMNLLMNFKNINEFKLNSIEGNITNFDILSQIMKPLTLKYKTKQFKDSEDFASSNNVLEVHNGDYLRGQLDKSVLGDGSKGILQRVCNDFGNIACADFIDDLQNIITEYMKSSAYSVGISDLIADANTNKQIVDKITEKKQEVVDLINETHLGLFENNTGKSNVEEFETRINGTLDQARTLAGKIGRTSLDANNRFVIMVNAGSKGSDLNISQMMSCLGQQNVDGKRIPYGFDNRTLPHYSKFDDSPEARGFVTSSFIGGLTPQELFFHAQGGRVGLIDTAVKTSQTGYIQRRLIKGCEDLIVEYDMTVRNNKGKIVQYSYGDDNIDPVNAEAFNLSFLKSSIKELYDVFHISYDKDDILTIPYTKDALKRLKKQKKETLEKCKFYTDQIIEYREKIIKDIFKEKDNSRVHIPVAFEYLIKNIQGQMNINSNSMIDITPFECFEMTEKLFEKLNKLHYCKPTDLFKVIYNYVLSPKNLLVMKRFNKSALELLIANIYTNYKKSIVAPGEMVGMIAAQSIGEPTTQMTLNTFHFAGVASKSNVTRGVPRIEEILSLSESPKNPSLSIYLKKFEETSLEKANSIMHMIEHTTLRNITKSVEICFDPLIGSSTIEDDNVFIQEYNEFQKMVAECNGSSEEPDTEKSKWIIRLELDPETMLEKNITMDDINFVLKNVYGKDISCLYSDYNSDKLIFRIRTNGISKKKKAVASLDQSDEIYMLKNFQENLLDNIILRGIKNIKKVVLRKIQDNLIESEGKYETKESWVLDTVGTNLLDVLGLEYIDSNRTLSNDISEIYNTFGIEAARETIYNELAEVIEFDGTYINYHHMSLLCDRMTNSHKMISIFRHGINNDDIGPLAKASFEETPEMFLKAARHAELDMMKGVSGNVMCGQKGLFGTNKFNVLLNLEEMIKLSSKSYDKKEDAIEKMFGFDDPNDKCSINNIVIQNNISNIEGKDISLTDDYEIDF